MISVSLSIPMTASAPRFAFAYAAETLLGESLTTHGGVIGPKAPAPDGMEWDIDISATSMSVSVAKKSDPHYDTDDLYTEFSSAMWGGFLQFLSEMPYTDAFLTVSLSEKHQDHSESSAELMMHYSTHGLGRPGVEAGPGTGFQTFDLSLDGDGRPAQFLSVVDDLSIATGFVAAMAERFPVTFGSILDEEASYGRAGWDQDVCGLSREESLAHSRDYLRGYAWITYVPLPLLSKIGGVAAAEASGVFHRVRELPGGLVELQATAEPASYGPRQVRDVHEFFAPLLAPAPDEVKPSYRADRTYFNPQSGDLWK